MIYSAQIRRVGEVEGEVWLNIKGKDLNCFAYNSMPREAKEGAFYPVELTPQVWGDYKVTELAEDAPASTVQIGNSFAYVVTGQLNGNRLHTVGGLEFEDDFLLSEFGYLEGKMVAWQVDRIDAEFLSDVPIG